ncbi:vesicle-associated protein 1-2-like isoform X1 [Vitis riparia]|uniref:vesicle-associated protein 1-2-like isoform X1 n=1 Tax=Vitis riparia TaxID=96939 RepID=UPI00155A1721|nr:vesicle-associated protein 1-2-like isoform X1 [Vitis riparia]XP_034684947.1 vesicle-associated protein 1-2-like isoform X1 [Vitis riparia]XP_034684948.1 vesicle-associated protein 1-2-like isoform X1 [Vitis riparia]XP_034684949.1 vesicle-associated protein 1-2-like isoform X1 [Vitis riparia]XP_034684950.1 vesicle-associated protein 1-2-like isoform X1 [Vitis riparia]XP_034684951.1 vesicle-associated protein 1-2-like isoform X1 [Vitis riparia]XP_034684952.1 vesicle-associated protein 1-2-l
MELLDIQPRELKFTFELKKQSSCSIHLVNKADLYIAFKVKTTSPKRYCVRPNTGVVKPNAECDVMVTMQAQRVAPPDMQCKDKFLIQSTVVPYGTTETDIRSDMFAKDSGKYIEEKKLRVVLIGPAHSPVLLPLNGLLKQDPCHEIFSQKDQLLSGVENTPPAHAVAKDVEGFKTAKVTDESRAAKDVESRPAEDVDELKLTHDIAKENLAKDIEELNSKLNVLELNLSEAKLTITKLTEERSMATREKETLKHELAMLRRKSDVRRVRVGFPFLFVLIIALIGIAAGYLMHS